MPHKRHSSLSSNALLCILLTCSACNRGPASSPVSTQGATKRYSLKGKVISLDKRAGSASIYNDPIQGFMDPMAMPYTVQPPATLEQLQPGDTITADVVVEPNKYWLENVKVIGHSQLSAEPPTDEKKDAKKNGKSNEKNK